MEPNFPTELPIGALRQLGLFVTRKDADLGRASLAAWQLVGFGLNKYFGEVRFMMAADAPIPPVVDVEETVKLVQSTGKVPDWVWPLALKIIERLVDKLLPPK